MNNPKNLRSCVPYLAKVASEPATIIRLHKEYLIIFSGGNLQYINEDRIDLLVKINRKFEIGEEVVIHFDDSL